MGGLLFVVKILVLWLLLHRYVVFCNAIVSDIDCLKSIKDSLVDPFSYLSSWNFNNLTEGFVCKFTGVECWHSEENKVINLQLTDMGLKGNFPRGLEKCTALVGLDLSRNQISGPIPHNISDILHFVTSLDLSSNNFSGEIPNSIANCSYLNDLRLDNNQLTGQIPPEFSQLNRIKTFSVANNRLSGPVPQFLSVNITAESYANNPGLCGHPLEHCEPASNQQKHDDRVSFFNGFAVGWPLSTFLVLFLVLSGKMPGMPHIQRMITWKPKNKKLTQPKANKENLSPSSQQITHNRKISTFEKLVTRVSFTELAKATDDFSENNIIGEGKNWILYRSVLRNGCNLAIKRFNHSLCFDEQFETEILTLGRLRHTNIVPLISFCYENKERLLVYKFMPNGNLYDFLHTEKGEAKTMIEWPLRVKIAVGLARGFAWLHHNSNFHVVHNKFSSKCILLDHNFESKISNFGDANFMRTGQTSLTGSFFVNGKVLDLSFKRKDVYSFGIVLLELVTGEEPKEVANSSKDFIATDIYNVVDTSLNVQGHVGEVFELLRIGFSCVQSVPDRRPTMLQVHNMLNVIAKKYGFADNSEIFAESEISEVISI